VEARGFILGAALALKLGKGFVPVRKKGKLPGKTVGIDYVLEYGTDRLELHEGQVPQGARVLLVDDLADSGVTLQKVREHLTQNYADVTEVRSAVIWVKGTSAFKPDYHLEDLPHNPWIHQPFEDYDGLRPHQLSAWLKKFEK